MSSNESTWFSVFDFDGVLIDSRENVKKAYEMVGVDMPDWAWGRPWNEWLPELVGSRAKAAVVHEAKNKHYTEMAPVFLPAFDVFTKLLNAYPTNVFILTGASKEAVSAVVPWAMNRTFHGRSAVQKFDILQTMAELRRVLYIDDMRAMAEQADRLTNAKGVHYTPTTDLEGIIRSWMQ